MLYEGKYIYARLYSTVDGGFYTKWYDEKYAEISEPEWAPSPFDLSILTFDGEKNVGAELSFP